MGRKKSPGLKKRGHIWWIDKRIKGYGRVAESCGTTNLAEAEQYLTFRLNEIRNAMVYGIRPTRTFQEAAIKFLEDNQDKKLIERYVYAFDRVMPHIGHLRLDRIHNDTLSSYRRARRADGVSAGTINKELSCVRRILNLAARVWRHDHGGRVLVTERKTGKPVAGAFVKLAQDGHLVAEGYTDARGIFESRGNYAGKLSAVAEKEGSCALTSN